MLRTFQKEVVVKYFFMRVKVEPIKIQISQTKFCIKHKTESDMILANSVTCLFKIVLNSNTSNVKKYQGDNTCIEVM